MLSVDPRHQLIDVVVWMTVDDPGEDVGQIAEWVDIVELTGFDQGGDGGPMLGTAVRPREQRVLSVERDGTDGAFDGVVVEFDAASVRPSQRDKV